jgi:transposase-like protein
LQASHLKALPAEKSAHLSKPRQTSVNVASNWAYPYRAIDTAGKTIEFMFSPNAI